MVTCRTVSPETWEHVRQALVFFFSRRCPFQLAEDLTQDTLATIWSRPDFEFEREEDFLKVAYGFASRILLARTRSEARHASEPLEDHHGSSSRSRSAMNPVELSILLEEVVRLGKTQLRAPEWDLIEVTAGAERGVATADLTPAQANNLRVKLYRARRKLEKLAGWGRE